MGSADEAQARRPDPWRPPDTAVTAVLALLYISIVWPRRSRFLNVLDSALFAGALEDYDFLRGHPHPPAYPVFVFLARIVHLFQPDPNAALVTVSVAFGALTVALLYAFARRLTSAMAALVAPAWLLFSPTLTYNAALALSYTAEAALAVGLAWAAWNTHQDPRPRAFLVLGGLFGLGLGLRTSILLFLTPLAAWGAWGAVRSTGKWREAILLSGGAAAVAVALWFIPMVLAGGGLRAWLDTTRLQTGGVVFDYNAFNAGAAAVAEHGGRLLLFLRPESAVLWTLVALAMFAAALSRAPIKTWFSAPETRMLATWVFPSLLFYVFIFSGHANGPRGYILVFLPALFLAASLLAERAAGGLRSHKHALTIALVVALLALPPISERPARDELLTKEIIEHDEWSSAWLAIRDEFSADDTAILSRDSWYFVREYLPEYRLWASMPVSPDPNGTVQRYIRESRERVDDAGLYDVFLHQNFVPAHPVPAEIQTIIVFDFQLAGENNGTRELRTDIDVEEAVLGNGWRILLFPRPENATTVEDWFQPNILAQPQPN